MDLTAMHAEIERLQMVSDGYKDAMNEQRRENVILREQIENNLRRIASLGGELQDEVTLGIKLQAEVERLRAIERLCREEYDGEGAIAYIPSAVFDLFVEQDTTKNTG